MKSTFRQAVFNVLKAWSDARMQVAHAAMQAAQSSANEEGKSSAGDKYETARAMGQLDRDMYARQYEQARQERQLLDRFADATSTDRVVQGSLARTSAGLFCVAVSAGKLTVDGQEIIAVSGQSPVGALLLGKRVGETFVFQNKKTQVLDIA